ncbi:MAG: hydrolase 1, exosortase A system-associated, partial [Massilia sp.]
NYKAAIGSFFSLMGAAMGAKKPAAANDAAAPTGAASVNAAPAAPAGPPLPDRMLAGLNDFKGKTLLILSGCDLTAQEFTDVTKASRKWQTLLSSVRVKRQMLAEADHTFSRRAWRDQVATWTGEWVRSW